MTAGSVGGHPSGLGPSGQQHREEECDITVTHVEATTKWDHSGEQPSRANGCFWTKYLYGYLVESQGYKQQKALQLLVNLRCSLHPQKGLCMSVSLNSDLYQCLKYPEMILQPQSPRPQRTIVLIKVLPKLVLLCKQSTGNIFPTEWEKQSLNLKSMIWFICCDRYVLNFNKI